MQYFENIFSQTYGLINLNILKLLQPKVFDFVWNKNYSRAQPPNLNTQELINANNSKIKKNLGLLSELMPQLEMKIKLML